MFFQTWITMEIHAWRWPWWDHYTTSWRENEITFRWKFIQFKNWIVISLSPINTGRSLGPVTKGSTRGRWLAPTYIWNRGIRQAWHFIMPKCLEPTEHSLQDHENSTFLTSQRVECAGVLLRNTFPVTWNEHYCRYTTLQWTKPCSTLGTTRRRHSRRMDIEWGTEHSRINFPTLEYGRLIIVSHSEINKSGSRFVLRSCLNGHW